MLLNARISPRSFRAAVLLGIIFATCSKPKKRKRHLVTDEIVAENDDINKISENSVDNEE